jgi:uncharacterized protein YndB with AHSA1/START domain
MKVIVFFIYRWVLWQADLNVILKVGDESHRLFYLWPGGFTFIPQMTYSNSILINAPVEKAWQALTDPEQIKKWMLDEEIHILTDWKPGSPIVIKGTLHWVDFENTGVILENIPGKLLCYNHLSSLSELPDQPENYTVIEFLLTPIENMVNLELTLSNFPTESIYKHLVLYWNPTLEIFRKFVEQQ